MPTSYKRAALNTLCYADIFDYPLTLQEIRHFLIGKKCPQKDIGLLKRQLENIPEIKKTNDFYHFRGKENTVSRRLAKNAISRKKVNRAKKICRLISVIPFIRLVAVTGAVAANNADKNDDIDLLLITSANRVWLVRFFAVLFLKITGRYRWPDGKNIRDKFCLNMYLDENRLALPRGERDIYSAREMAQLMPLYNKDNDYQKFAATNSWIKNFLPNAFDWQKISGFRQSPIKHAGKSGYNILSLLNNLSGFLQKSYMKGKRTNEVVQDGYLRFHPQDARKIILSAYRIKLNQYS